MRKCAVWFCLALLLVVGCSKNRVTLLNDRTEVYNRSLKWGSVRAAGKLIAESSRRTLIEKMAREVGRNPIVSYSILDLSLDPAMKKASALVEFSYYGVSDQTLHYRQEVQTWQWDSKKGNWYVLEARSVPKKRS